MLFRLFLKKTKIAFLLFCLKNKAKTFKPLSLNFKTTKKRPIARLTNKKALEEQGLFRCFLKDFYYNAVL